MSHQGFTGNSFQSAVRPGGHSARKVLDADRHLGTRATMFAGDLIEISHRVVTDAGHFCAFSFTGHLQKVFQLHDAKL